MPLYRCFTTPETLDDGQRSAIARAVTDIHCDATGAPPTFVHVQFLDADPERSTDADPRSIRLHGGLRAGRPPEVTDSIVARCRAEVAGIAGIDPDRITMRVSETPASWIYEGGRVLPEPGQEGVWMASSGSTSEGGRR